MDFTPIVARLVLDYGSLENYGERLRSRAQDIAMSNLDEPELDDTDMDELADEMQQAMGELIIQDVNEFAPGAVTEDNLSEFMSAINL